MKIKRQNSYARNAERFNQEAQETVDRIKREEDEELKERLPEIKRKAHERELMFQEVFDHLKTGDSLSFFGRPDIIIEKKNKKTVKASGVCWSLTELRCL